MPDLFAVVAYTGRVVPPCGKRGERLEVRRIHAGGRRSALPSRTDLRSHSPAGFAWGYGGSGPAQLALALCADHLRDDQLAQRLYQDVKDVLVAPLPQDADWTLSREDVAAAIATVRREHHEQGEQEPQAVADG